MPSKKYPNVDYIRQCVRQKNGRIFWLKRPRSHFATQRAFSTWNARFARKEAGNVCFARGRPRWVVSIDGHHYLRHVLVWAVNNGRWVTGIDHRNRNPLDDRIENLRVANQSQNGANCPMRSTNTSGYKGVTWDKVNRKWIAQIGVKGRHIKIGRFADPDEAHAAYAAAAEKHFGEFACGG